MIARAGMLAVTAIVSLGLTAGCRKTAAVLDESDRADQFVQRAKTRQSEGKTDEAVRLYNEALAHNPAPALAHLELALVLHDQQKDYVPAIYHYKRYLELRPQTEKRDLIENRIRLAGQAFAATVQESDRGRFAGNRSLNEEEKEAYETKIAALTKQNVELKERVNKTQADINKLMARIDRLEADRERLAAELEKARGQTARPQAGTARPATSPASRLPSQDEPAKPAKRTYRVRSGDTLMIIAARFYEDPQKWRLILDANRDVLGRSETLKVGQTLVIP